jgi:hypothetical protein
LHLLGQPNTFACWGSPARSARASISWRSTPTGSGRHAVRPAQLGSRPAVYGGRRPEPEGAPPGRGKDGRCSEAARAEPVATASGERLQAAFVSHVCHGSRWPLAAGRYKRPRLTLTACALTQARPRRRRRPMRSTSGCCPGALGHTPCPSQGSDSRGSSSTPRSNLFAFSSLPTARRAARETEPRAAPASRRSSSARAGTPRAPPAPAASASTMGAPAPPSSARLARRRRWRAAGCGRPFQRAGQLKRMSVMRKQAPVRGAWRVPAAPPSGTSVKVPKLIANLEPFGSCAPARPAGARPAPTKTAAPASATTDRAAPPRARVQNSKHSNRLKQRAPARMPRSRSQCRPGRGRTARPCRM